MAKGGVEHRGRHNDQALRSLVLETAALLSLFPFSRRHFLILIDLIGFGPCVAIVIPSLQFVPRKSITCCSLKMPRVGLPLLLTDFFVYPISALLAYKQFLRINWIAMFVCVRACVLPYLCVTCISQINWSTHKHTHRRTTNFTSFCWLGFLAFYFLVFVYWQQRQRAS